ncbi:Up-regulated During Septation domain containing protein [Rhypophila decipiens]
MAHIISCMLDSDSDDISSFNNYISRALTPQPSNESLGRESPSGEKPFVWRMMHQSERKYQLFPKGKQPAAAPGKSLDPEQAFALAMGQNGEQNDRTTTGTGLRIRIKEHNLIRRRKVSVPELGPMTTVQEVAMDSPTIPGRPPLHERSISAPGTSWKPQQADNLGLHRDQSLDERPELDDTRQTVIEDGRLLHETRQPLSPKSLAPLVIPNATSAVPRLTRQLSLSRLRAGSAPIETTLRSARTDDSPKARTPYTPLSAALTPLSAATSTMTTSTLPTPVSAPIEARSSPKPWERPAPGPGSTLKETTVTVPDPFSTPRAPEQIERTNMATAHRRNQSDTGSIMERGRPRKRNESISGSIAPKRTASKRSKSAERRAFEQLPRGWKASEAVNMLSQSEVTSIQKQALEQAARFEVLRKEDVDGLSRELRQLDERTEYLRRTYTSLRAGRRNLHTRICQYLRSPRTATFSHASILKQEEALAELDSSIDDWVMKLEQAENRRTRVRQKLLEHVAAAATLSLPTGGVAGVSESLQLAMGVRPLNSSNGAGNISTPPRSPTKTVFTSHAHSSSPSPQRVVAQVPSTIFEEASINLASPKEDAATTLRRAETIRIYADNDVYALLADVESAFTKMSAGDYSSGRDEPVSEAERKTLHRAQSHDVLSSSTKSSCYNNSSHSSANSSSDEKSSPSCSGTSSAASTPPPVPEKEHAEIYLTSAVFKP